MLIEKLIPSIIALLAASLASSSCGTTRNAATVGGYLANSALTGSVEAALAADPITRASAINVASYSGIVELSGSVSSSDERSAATSVALSVDGVETVLNVLQLDHR